MHSNETIIIKQLILTVVAMAIVTTIGITTTMTTMAYADPNNPTADENVHDNTPGGFGERKTNDIMKEHVKAVVIAKHATLIS